MASGWMDALRFFSPWQAGKSGESANWGFSTVTIWWMTGGYILSIYIWATCVFFWWFPKNGPVMRQLTGSEEVASWTQCPWSMCWSWLENDCSQKRGEWWLLYVIITMLIVISCSLCITREITISLSKITPVPKRRNSIYVRYINIILILYEIHISMDWFKEKSTGNYGFSHWIWVFPVYNFPLKPIHWI